MNHSETPDVYFSDEKMAATFGPQLGGLAAKIALACNDDASKMFGKEYFQNPSTVELTPYINSTDGAQPEIVVRAWHETGIPGKSAVFQVHDTVMEMTFSREDAYLSNKDSRANYQLTTREAFLLHNISGAAFINYIHNSQGK